MKRLIALVALVAVALTACGSAATPAPTVEPTPDVEATARAVAEEVFSQVPTPEADQVITLFDEGDIDVFARDQKITDRFETLGGYYREGVFCLWAEVSDDSLPENGRDAVMFRVNEPLPFEFGGVGPKLGGNAEWWNRAASVSGTLKYDPSAGMWFVEVAGDRVSFVSSTGRGDDFPASFHYGFNVHGCAIVP